MNIEEVNIDTIRPYWRNPRKNDNAVEPVKESIRNYGYNQPIVVDDDNVIIVGHTRYKALRELGYKNIAIVKLELDDEKAKQYRIADNKTNEKAEWDEDLLLYELREVEGLEDMKIFFDDGELDSIINIREMDMNELSFENPLEDEEEEREKKVEAKVRTEIKDELGDEYESKLEEEREKIEKEVEERTQDKMKEDIRKEMEEEQRRIDEENRIIAEKEAEEKRKFQEASKNKEEDYVEVECPHCDEEFILSRKQLLKS